MLTLSAVLSNEEKILRGKYDLFLRVPRVHFRRSERLWGRLHIKEASRRSYTPDYRLYPRDGHVFSEP